MKRDWKRLAVAVRAAREALELTQVELALKAGVSESTIQLLEAGEPRSQLPRSRGKVEQALDWAPGSIVSILEGGAPSPRPHAAEAAVDEAPGGAKFAEGMPLRAARELQQGRVVEAAVSDLSPPGSKSKFIVVWKTDEEAEGSEITAEDLAKWSRVQRALRGLPGGEPESGK